MGAWGPPDDGEGMDVDSVTDMAGVGVGARSGVGLGSGEVSLRGGRAGLGCQTFMVPRHGKVPILCLSCQVVGQGDGDGH